MFLNLSALCLKENACEPPGLSWEYNVCEPLRLLIEKNVFRYLWSVLGDIVLVNSHLFGRECLEIPLFCSVKIFVNHSGNCSKE